MQNRSMGGMTLELWYHAQGASGDAAEAVTSALRAAGLRLSAWDIGSTQDHGVLIVGDDAQEACRFLAERALQSHGRVLVILLAPPVATDHAVALLRAGAGDVVAWDRAGASTDEIVRRIRRWHHIDTLVRSPRVRQMMVGDSPCWIDALRELVAIAQHSEASVLITGENGTGKEVAARLVHLLDPRPKTAGLVVVDCATIVPELAGSELFGHERGAFTGATGARDGAFALADGGTLFLDEVGELPLPLQAQLLRVIQERSYKRVGGNGWSSTRFRLLCATNRDLVEEVGRGRFRRDLYHRIAPVTLRLPSLAERPDDVLPLVAHFLRELVPDGPLPELDEQVRRHLCRRAYPGNVRELQHLVARLLHRNGRGRLVTVGDMPIAEWPADGSAAGAVRGLEPAVRAALTQGLGLRELGRAATDMAIRVALQMSDGNLQLAAKRLGITDRALQMRRAEWRQRGAAGSESQDAGAADALSGSHGS